jgi:DNA-binding PadR family transcriptional regulator
MVKAAGSATPSDKLALELRRGAVVLATLSQLGSRRYGYSLVQRLAEQGLEIEQGTLYPLLRRLDEQGLLDSDWKVDGPRPRKYYQLSEEGWRVLAELEGQWRGLVEVMAGLLSLREGE